MVNGYENLKATQGEKDRSTIQAAKRAVELYEKWQQPDRANKYRVLP